MNIMEKFSLKGCVSIVTGGERGIGLAIATGLAQAGSDIVIAGMAEDSFDNAKQQIEAEGVKCSISRVNVTSEQEVTDFVSDTKKQFGKIDVLVNNAGITRAGKAEELSLENWNLVLNVNLTGPFLVSREVGKVMLEQGKGSIVNIASMSGMIVNTPQEQCNYNASKGGLIMLTKSMACEWGERGVRVNAIAPGYIRTPLSEHRFKDPENPVVKRWLSMQPIGRVGSPDELVGMAVYLASEASSYATGSVMVVDGGYTSW